MYNDNLSNSRSSNTMLAIIEDNIESIGVLKICNNSIKTKYCQIKYLNRN